MHNLNGEKPSDRELLETIVHSVDRLELGQRDVSNHLGRTERELRGEILGIRSELSDLRTDVSGLRSEVSHFRNEVSQRFDTLEEQTSIAITDHEVRITVLEKR